MRKLAKHLALISAVLLAIPASAEEPPDWTKREFTTPEIAADLAYGLCPLFLAGQLDLEANYLLEERGFASKVKLRQVEPHGEIGEVTAIRPDGSIHFGGAPGRLCNVTVNGTSRDETLDRLRSHMMLMGLVLQPDPANSGTFGATTIEAFAGPAENQILHVQLGVTEVPVPSVIAQLYVTDE